MGLTGTGSAFRVLEQQARKAQTYDAMVSYLGKYLRTEHARLMLELPE